MNEIEQLKAENTKLKEEIEIRDNLSEKFRKEALSWANIANEYQKDKTKLEQTLQEIKEIAERQLLVTNVRTYQMVYYADFSEYRNEILDLITKAGSEEE